jgi:hypothetical protein
MFRENTASIPSISVWMYSAATNCRQRRVDGAEEAIFFASRAHLECKMPLISGCFYALLMKL